MSIKKSVSSDTPAPVEKSGRRNVGVLINQLNKKFGDNAVTVGVPQTKDYIEGKLRRIPTGSFSLDVALGGGIPIGRYTEISGAFSATKTTQALHIVRNAQNLGLQCFYVDVERATDEKYMKSLDVDTDALIYMSPDGMEEALQSIIDAQKSGTVNLAVLDSIAALCPTKEQEAEMDESLQMGIPQKLLGEFFRKFQAANNRLVREGQEPFTVLGINQLREAIGKMYGDPEYAPGGRSRGFTAAIDIRLRPGKQIFNTDKKSVGQEISFKVFKNKTYRPLQNGMFDFYFTDNEAKIKAGYVDLPKEIISLGVEFNVIQRAGAYYMYNDFREQGVENFMSSIFKSPEVVEEIKQKVLAIATTPLKENEV